MFLVYIYYFLAAIQTANLEYERMIIHDLANPDPPSNVSELCPTGLGATGSEYKLLIKKGNTVSSFWFDFD